MLLKKKPHVKKKQLSNVGENKRGPQVIIAGNVPSFVLVPKETRTFLHKLF